MVKLSDLMDPSGGRLIAALPRPTPARRPNYALSNPQWKGGGCLLSLASIVLALTSLILRRK